MESMNVYLLLFFILFSKKLYFVKSLATMSQHEKMEFEMKLKLINKPSIKSFQTETGDILDCIEIHKQVAFDHPHLKNHSIQMKPSRNIPKLGRPSSRIKALKFFSKKIQCPKGCVLVKRARIEEIVTEKFSTLPIPKFEDKEPNPLPPGYQVAHLGMTTQNVGVHGNINVWSVDQVNTHQFISSQIFVANGNGTSSNGIVAGWFVHPRGFGNFTRLFTYWTSDDGKSTGCFNTLCPGFVQVSRKYPVGIVLFPLSTYDGPQYEIDLIIVQDDITGNWWVKLNGENLGYFPKELFTSLASAASYGGWGGDIHSSIVDNYPPMGSGHFPEERFGKAAFISQMKFLDPSHQIILPDPSKLMAYMSLKRCYRLLYIGDTNVGHTMYFGGPPNCTII